MDDAAAQHQQVPYFVVAEVTMKIGLSQAEYDDANHVKRAADHNERNACGAASTQSRQRRRNIPVTQDLCPEGGAAYKLLPQEE